MGVFDFAKDAGANLGIGKSKAEEEKEKKLSTQLKETAKAKAAADREAKRAAAAKKKAAERAKAAKERAKAAAEAEAEREAKKGAELEAYVTKMGLKVQRLSVKYDDGVATVRGTVRNRAQREKVVLAIGNVKGVSKVNDRMTVKPGAKGAPPATAAARKAAASRRKAAAAAQTMHKVKSGDTLSKLAKRYLGDANRYPEIFKANQPMLTDPDKIMVGQVLRIPKA